MPFTTATLRFFHELARNNAKPWFEAHRADYEGQVREPMRALIEEMDVRLARFAPEITGDPKRSMFRIYRDIRFSKDKSPYKTHAAARWLRYQSFTAGRRLSDSQAKSARLPALLAADFARLLPLVRWLNGALGLRAATRR